MRVLTGSAVRTQPISVLETDTLLMCFLFSQAAMDEVHRSFRDGSKPGPQQRYAPPFSLAQQFHPPDQTTGPRQFCSSCRCNVIVRIPWYAHTLSSIPSETEHLRATVKSNVKRARLCLLNLTPNNHRSLLNMRVCVFGEVGFENPSTLRTSGCN